MTEAAASGVDENSINELIRSRRAQRNLLRTDKQLKTFYARNRASIMPIQAVKEAFLAKTTFEEYLSMGFTEFDEIGGHNYNPRQASVPSV